MGAEHKNRESLVPVFGGKESYSFDDNLCAVMVYEGSGFDPDNIQHTRGSSAVRYGIAIQQARTAGDYESADAKRKLATFLGHDVGTGKGVTAISMPGMGQRNGIIYDAMVTPKGRMLGNGR